MLIFLKCAVFALLSSTMQTVLTQRLNSVHVATVQLKTMAWARNAMVQYSKLLYRTAKH